MSEQDVLAPETFYAASKAGATHLAGAFSRQYAKPIFTIRPFSVYGPGEADFRFIPTVIRSMLAGTSFPLDAQAKHDWIYIDDLISAVLLVMDKAPNLTEGYKILNVGSGRMHTNEEVCDALKKIAGWDVLATPVRGLRHNDSEVWLADTRLISTLGFVPQYTLAAGLRCTFDYYRHKYSCRSRV